MRRPLATAAFVAALCVLVPSTAMAYVGPGAGFAVVATALALVLSVLALIVGVLFYPFRMLWRLVTRKRPPNKPSIKRAVVDGLDGLDPLIAKRLMNDGRLPNVKRIADKGTFKPLGTTTPAMSPVAWSSFATGVDPSKHGVFDFLTRDTRTYLPVLSSAEVGPPRRHLDIGPYRIPLGRPELRLLRKSKSFWSHLGKYRIPANVLRVPITFPPEKFEGNLLSAMCVPDMLGTQGSFTFFTTRPEEEKPVGGRRVAISIENGCVQTTLEGPENPIRHDGQKVVLPLSLQLNREAGTAELRISGKRFVLKPGDYTKWVHMAFPMGIGFKVKGIARFRLTEMTEEHVGLYVTPINIDPGSPALPISHPFLFSVFLAKLNGAFATLGLAEDTWALNEGVLDDDGFLEQAQDIHEEREKMFFQMLRRTPKGLLACVFDGSDRVQHMFMRFEDDDHPALRGRDDIKKRPDAIGQLYERMDGLVGKVLKQVDIDDPRNLLIVMSDHGFKTFRRGINVNKWLYDNGYLVLEEGREKSGEWLQGVDWSKTRAFAVGLGGIFLNVEDREKQGIVPEDQKNALADEIAARLRGLVDPANDEVAIRECYTTHSIFDGPYADEAPDIFVGYEVGWRMSWDGARGLVHGEVFTDNTKAWSGDHCIDPKVVPGILLSNHRLAPKGHPPEITDVAPTILEMFGVPTPRYMDGRSLMEAPE